MPAFHGRRHPALGVVLALLGLPLSTGTATAEDQKPTRVGQIFVVGNTATPQWVILGRVPVFLGCKLSLPDLKKAEKNLERLGLFVTDPKNGIRPTVTVLDPVGEGEYRDILVTIQEKPWNWLLFDVWDLVEARVTLNLSGMNAAAMRLAGDILARLHR